ncbi:hypothetical protein H1P_110059 [Hyella patelloides LEGE 07179]|uniref:Uncharacterized protein n=1 Tax=Hyella patelloides LEGE 07179 TaxID=945734 RepID=A0A563VJK6_9CYAN|nr:hypothetical protein H1P_110059 [Hyella patelloides LEGE 07179]
MNLEQQFWRLWCYRYTISPQITAMGVEPISSSVLTSIPLRLTPTRGLVAYEAGALTVMLRCFKHRARLELAINSFADYRLTNLATDANNMWLYSVFKVRVLASSIERTTI